MPDARVDILLALRSKIDGADKLVNVLGGLAKGAVLGAAAYALFAAKQGMAFGADMEEAARRLGTTSTVTQVLARATEDANGEFSEMEKALDKMRESEGKAIAGNGQLTESFATLNLSARSLKDMPIERQLEAIARSFVNAKDKGAAFNAITEILGTKNAPKLMEVIQRLGKDGFDGLSADIEKSYGLIDEKTTKLLADSATKLHQLQARFQIFAANSLSEAIPDPEGLEIVANALITPFKGWKLLLEEAGKDVGNLVNQIQGLPTSDFVKQAQAARAAIKFDPSLLSDAQARQARVSDLEFQLQNRRADLASIDHDITLTDTQKQLQKLALMKEELDILREQDALKKKEEGTPQESVLGHDAHGNDVKGLSPDALKIAADQDKRAAAISALSEELDRAKLSATGLDTAFNTGLNESIRGILSGTQNLQQAFIGLGTSIENNVIDSISKMAADYITKRGIMAAFGRSLDALETSSHVGKETVMTAATVSGTAARVGAVQTEAAATAQATGIGAIFHSIMELGPIAGPIVMATAVVGLLALVSKLSRGFSSGGYTGDEGGVVHADEWVAPAWMVNHPVMGSVINSMEAVRSGGGGSVGASGGGGGGGKPQRVIHVVAPSAKKAQQMQSDPNFDNYLLNWSRRNLGLG